MMVMDLLIPFIIMGFGKYFTKNVPKEIDKVFEYRTPMSMKNEETWEFAHRYCGRLRLTIGRIMFVLLIIAMLFVIGKDENVITNS